MTLHKIRDFDPHYRDHFNNQDLIGYDLYAGGDKVGSVDDVLVDDAGKLRYLVINTGFWVLGKQLLLPIGRVRIENNSHRVIADGLTREQVEALPKYDSKIPVDYEHEEQVRSAYPPTGMTTGTGNTMASSAYDRDTYSYDSDPELYNLNERNHQSLRLYEERLIASKTRTKTGEVAVGKHVETETARVAVPIEKERVVIDRTTQTDVGTVVATGEATFKEVEIARMEVYEETPDIRKEAFVHEEVSVRKEIDRDTVNAKETLRREELDLDTEGRPVVDRGLDTSRSRDRV